MEPLTVHDDDRSKGKDPRMDCPDCKKPMKMRKDKSNPKYNRYEFDYICKTKDCLRGEEGVITLVGEPMQHN